MRIVKGREFLKVPEGTPFAMGDAFCFGGLFIKGENIDADIYWGFWAFDPCWIDGSNDKECFARLEKMARDGASYPMSDAFDKYLSGADDLTDETCFLIFEASDVLRLNKMMATPEVEGVPV